MIYLSMKLKQIIFRLILQLFYELYHQLSKINIEA